MEVKLSFPKLIFLSDGTLPTLFLILNAKLTTYFTCIDF